MKYILFIIYKKKYFTPSPLSLQAKTEYAKFWWLNLV